LSIRRGNGIRIWRLEMRNILGFDFDPDVEVCVPVEVVQWRIEAEADELALIHTVSTGSVYECRYLLYDGKRHAYEPGDLVRIEKEGCDGKTVFILKEWEI
jgi:hypothetical protein